MAAAGYTSALARRGGAREEGPGWVCGGGSRAVRGLRWGGGPEGGGLGREQVEGEADDGHRVAARAAAEVDAGQCEQELAEVPGSVRGLRGSGGRGRRGVGLEESACGGELGGDVAGCEQAMMADLDEASGQDVQDEASEKLGGGERDRLASAGAEGDGLIVERDEALVGEADAMGVAAEVTKDLVAVAEGGFAVDDPALLFELVEGGVEARCVGEGSGRTDEAEQASSVGGAQAVDALHRSRPSPGVPDPWR